MSDIPIRVQILNISMNFSRLGEWMAIDYVGKKDLIDRFWTQTNEYFALVDTSALPAPVAKSLSDAKLVFERLANEREVENKRLEVSERLLAWANILEHGAPV